MAKLEYEAEFLARWLAYVWNGDHAQAERLGVEVAPEMLESGLGAFYTWALDRYVKGGKPMDDMEVTTALSSTAGAGNAGNILGWAEQLQASPAVLAEGMYARSIQECWQAKRQALLLRDMAHEAKAAYQEAKAKGFSDKPRQVAERTTAILLELGEQRAGPAERRPHTRQEFSALELEGMDSGRVHGITIPLPKLDEEAGPMLPGEFWGMTGFSNQGKTRTVIGGFVLPWLRRGVPCIIVPTESGMGFMRRVWAAEAGVSQKHAAKRQYSRFTPEEKAAYRDAIERLKDAPWELIDVPDITPEQIKNRVRILRRKYPGQHVVVIIDHMHRLNYGGEEPDKMVGESTQDLRNFARTDTDGGMSVLALYQPSQPEQGASVYKPVRMYKVRGHSKTANEFDVHMGPYRRWVQTVQIGPEELWLWETDPAEAVARGLFTPWGTPRCLLDAQGYPIFVPPPPEGQEHLEGAKLDDEHTYLKVDKRREGGEVPYTLIFETDGRSGRIFELDRRHDLFGQPTFSPEHRYAAAN